MTNIRRFNRIIARIENLNLNKQQVAAMCGLHLITIQRLYAGAGDKARISTLEKLEKALDKKEEEVLNFIMEMRNAANKKRKENNGSHEEGIWKEEG